ncbi:GntR family transcriptional regulator (plasmid) [Peteryoungia desertarenae]|uniref:GntR family transcriptional regulator n=1 Tax=Peteryoungia desertarenae TaxID=1813451 RepID=A0ABX6QUH3_9HYPH|nr:GntR family transcriptional regulator [Peteryoungia desertarenae]QLF71897.1 GntR family transcriptional regulator [Peteryoungia desertarenae]
MTDERDSAPKQQSARALTGLRDLVLKGDIQPGERLSEVALSARLDVSRTPLRAALQKLEQEGLVELIPSGGYAVRSFSRQDVTDSIELRGVLEGTAARLAAERGVPPQRIKAISDVLDALDDAVGVGPDGMDLDRYEALNGKFHRLLWELSGSQIVAKEVSRMASLPFANPNAFVNADLDVPAFHRTLLVGQAQHRAIVSAILMREGARAEALAREHARLARQNLDFVLEEQPDLRSRMAALALMAV